MIAGILGGLDHRILNRPRPVTQIEEPYEEPWESLNGVSLGGLRDRPQRPEPADRSGARI